MDEKWVGAVLALLMQTKYHDDLLWHMLTLEPSASDMYAFMIELTTKRN